MTLQLKIVLAGIGIILGISLSIPSKILIGLNTISKSNAVVGVVMK